MAEPSGLSFGVVSGDPMAQSSLGRVCAELGRGLGRSVRGVVLQSYSELSSSLAAGALDIVWAPPLTGQRMLRQRLASAACCPRRAGGLSYHAAIFQKAGSARKDRLAPPGDELYQLRGLRAAWVDPASLSGFVLARRFLERRGTPPSSLFVQETFCGTHSAVARAVFEGSADVGCTYLNLDPQTDRIVDAGWSEIGVATEGAAVVVRLGPVPADAIFVARQVPEALRLSIVKCLCGLSGPALASVRTLFRAELFEPAPANYAAVLAQIEG